MESTLAHLLVCTVIALCVALIYHKTAKTPSTPWPWLVVAIVGAIMSFWLAASSGILTRNDFSTNWWLGVPLVMLGSALSCGLRWLVIQRRQQQ
ncbi:MAG: hypothetical protein KA340_09575 [Saprospiraceae bacterium]|nr:hypothetical protein [Saprospiraceae bacterium]